MNKNKLTGKTLKINSTATPDRLDLISKNDLKIIPFRFSPLDIQRLGELVEVANKASGVKVSKAKVIRALLKMGVHDKKTFCKLFSDEV